MFGRGPTCSVSGCTRPTDGVVTIPTSRGGFRVSVCTEHGHRSSGGELLVFDVLASKYALGGGGPRSAVYVEAIPGR